MLKFTMISVTIYLMKILLMNVFLLLKAFDKIQSPIKHMLKKSKKWKFNQVMKQLNNFCKVCFSFTSFFISKNTYMFLLFSAQERRRVAKTLLNQSSSRSHSVFSIRLVTAPLQKDRFYPVNNNIHVSEMSLVDLAGSERAKRTENTGDRLAESNKINQSLLTLRQCFDKLRYGIFFFFYLNSLIFPFIF